MPNYNSTLQSNNTDLQAILNTINELPNAGGEQATPVISVNSTNGLITATAGTKSSTHQLAFQAAKTITPSTASQIAVSSGYYTGGNITVAAIPNSYVKPSYTKAATTYMPATTNLTISAGTYLTGVQTISGDSNLVAGNIKSGVNIFGVTGTYVGSGGGGDTSVEDGIITKTITSYTNDRVTTISTYAFCYCYNLTTVSFPSCKTIYNNAFCFCSNLTTVSFPVCTSIYNNAFYSCTNLTTVSFPLCKTIYNSAFSYCTNLTTVSFPSCTSIGSNAFYSCYKLTAANFPSCKIIFSSAFCFCSNLATASFPACTNIHSNAFFKCYNLKSLYLTCSSLCKLSNSNAFSSTPIGGYSTSAKTYGSIYVPASLLASYKAATNWTYFSSRFVGI
jgi:hypothetical protein